MAKLTCALVLLALAVTANALKCYECPLGCQGEDKNKWQTQDCGSAGGNQKKVCLKQVIDIPNSPQRVIRKCALVPEGKPKFECVDVPGEKTVNCESCTDDLCNSAPAKFNLGLGAVFAVVVPVLASKFLLH